MPHYTHSSESSTHEVLNQARPLQDFNAYEQDPVLRESTARWHGAWAEEDLSAFGARCGSAEFLHTGYLANKHEPELHSHDRFGFRQDEIEYHPAYHEIMRAGVAAGIHALPWRDPRPGAHVVRAAKHYLLSQVEPGPGCPLTMTFSGVPALEAQPEAAEEWRPRLLSTQYDPRLLPAGQKMGCQMGMAMTEKQGGSDVRANTTRAQALGPGGPGEEYHITGHKWFVSAAMSDAFLMLAQAPGGLSCFLAPQFKPCGERNVLRIQRLKDKLGNRSNASSEVEFENTWGRMIGEEGRGVPTIIEMVSHTRLDCALGSASLMRKAAAEAAHHARHRAAFGKPLAQHPLMRNVLASLALEWEAAATMAFWLASLYDRVAGDKGLRPLQRLATAVTKYWVCKRGPHMVYEALECLGGNGYVESGPMPRLYREAPLLSVWEGSGNVICLDVLKTMAREPEALPALLAEIGQAKGQDARFDAHCAQLEASLRRQDNIEMRARLLVEQMALALQGALLIQHAPEAVVKAFCLGRLDAARGHEYGALPPEVDCSALVARATPQLD